MNISRNYLTSLAADINNPRLQFQFGRVLEIDRRYSWAEHF